MTDTTDHQLGIFLTALDKASRGDQTRRMRILAAFTRMLTDHGITPSEAAHFSQVLHEEPPEDTTGRCVFIAPLA